MGDVGSAGFLESGETGAESDSLYDGGVQCGARQPSNRKSAAKSARGDSDVFSRSGDGSVALFRRRRTER